MDDGTPELHTKPPVDAAAGPPADPGKGGPDLGLLPPRLLETYRDGLLSDTIPFWFPRAVDQEHGGYITSLDRDGSWLQTDKAVWFQGRGAWLLSTLYNTVERRPEWLEHARSGVLFLQRHCFDTDGRMFFLTSRDGRPLRKRRYLFSEAFAVIAFAAFGTASGQPPLVARAEELFQMVLRYHRTPGLLSPKVDARTRPMKGLSMPMILIATAQELRKATGDPSYTDLIDGCIREIRTDFVKPGLGCVLETVGADGEIMETFEGRTVNPGHAIEVGWFILEESRLRGNQPDLTRLGCWIVDRSLEMGWDPEHGGLFYHVDARGLPCTDYWSDMKFWWPHNEAINACLVAFELTGDGKYARWLRAVHEWSHARFPDPVHGEWFGYLHRDGTVSTRLKGNVWKGPFHLPRMQWFCWQRLAAMQASARRRNPRPAEVPG